MLWLFPPTPSLGCLERPPELEFLEDGLSYWPPPLSRLLSRSLSPAELILEEGLSTLGALEPLSILDPLEGGLSCL